MPLFPSDRSRRALRRTGFSLVEMAIALFVFGMITLLFGAVFPVASRASHTSGNYAEAALLAQHKIDQCRQATYSNVYGATGNGTTSLLNLGMIDSPQPAGYPIVSGSTRTYSFSSVDDVIDNGTDKGFYPVGSKGELTVAPVPSGAGWNAPTSVQAVEVTVTITWAGGSQGDGSYKASTILSNVS